jgi:tetratricopeptide (TPR) repeat protein
MRTFPDQRMGDLTAAAHQARQHLDEGRWAEAREGFTQLRARAAKLGVASAYASWGLAVALDMNQETEMAFTVIQDAIAEDPLNPAAQSSFDAIAWKLRTAIGDAARPADDPAIPRIYRLLLEAGEADVASHVAMARHLAGTGDLDGARRLLDAVTLLAPVSRDAWLARGALARADGDAALAAECDAQAAALATTRVPFGIPGVAGAC